MGIRVRFPRNLSVPTSKRRFLMNQGTMDAKSSHKKLTAWSMTIGILLMVLGVVTIIFSVTTTFVTMLLIGGALAIRGLFEGVFALSTMHEEWFWRRLLGGVLSLVIGLLVLSRPELTAAAFTLFIAAFLIAQGLFKTIAAPVTHAGNWGWDMIAGVISLIAGLWVWSGWPINAFWIVGLLVGVEILSQGIVITALPYAFGKVSEREHAAMAR